MIVNTELAQSKGCDQKDRWATPQQIFDILDRQFKFTLDPCAEPHTAKCKKFYTIEDDGLSKDWTGEIVFMNPPYSRGNIDKWVEKAASYNRPTIVVGLLPVSTSSDWWHRYIIGNAGIWFVNKRIRFVGAPYTAPFSSVIVIWKYEGVNTFCQKTGKKHNIHDF